nr:DUF6665 family protein [Propylenella binzhouense]
MRPPRSLHSRAAKAPADVLEYEVAAEKASALGRAGRRLEDALAALAAHGAGSGAEEPPAARAALLDAAGEALWHLVIQRELCGLRNTEAMMRDYKVPAAVRARMGVRRPVEPR